MAKIRAVFWDVDGTLADTEMEGHRLAFNSAFSTCGFPWQWDRQTYAELLRIPGGGARMKSFARQQGQELDEQVLNRLKVLKHASYKQRIRAGEVSWRPGVRRLICELSEAGLQQWIVTTSGHDSVEELLIHAFPDGDAPFKGWITAENVSRRKPDPEAYQQALAASGVTAAEGLAIEDSKAGLASATAAGLACLLTPSPWDLDLPSMFEQAIVVVDHLGDPGQPCTLISGPPCAEAKITLEYLQKLHW